LDRLNAAELADLGPRRATTIGVTTRRTPEVRRIPHKLPWPPPAIGAFVSSRSSHAKGGRVASPYVGAALIVAFRLVAFVVANVAWFGLLLWLAGRALD
jgi:hypothetical protein